MSSLTSHTLNSSEVERLVIAAWDATYPGTALTDDEVSRAALFICNRVGAKLATTFYAPDGLAAASFYSDAANMGDTLYHSHPTNAPAAEQAEARQLAERLVSERVAEAVGKIAARRGAL